MNPTCDDEMLEVARLAYFWNSPVMGRVAKNPEIDNQNLYPTVIQFAVTSALGFTYAIKHLADFLNITSVRRLFFKIIIVKFRHNLTSQENGLWTQIFCSIISFKLVLNYKSLKFMFKAVLVNPDQRDYDLYGIVAGINQILQQKKLLHIEKFVKIDEDAWADKETTAQSLKTPARCKNFLVS